MVFDERLADRVRKVLAEEVEASERKMFGGLSFMVRGNMCLGIVGDDLVVRVGPGRYDKALTRRDTRPMDFTGKPLKGYVYVGLEGYRSGKALRDWVNQALEFNKTLPAK
jgi:TfoX/Sxy family transcriptional regulator of competence genes